MASFSRKKNVNVMRIGVKIIATVIGLYASGFMLNVIGNVMQNTSSGFYQGLSLIGWTLSTVQNSTVNPCGENSCGINSCSAVPDCITSTNGTGLLAVIGLLAIVWIVFEFVDVKL